MVQLVEGWGGVCLRDDDDGRVTHGISHSAFCRAAKNGSIFITAEAQRCNGLLFFSINSSYFTAFWKNCGVLKRLQHFNLCTCLLVQEELSFKSND